MERRWPRLNQKQDQALENILDNPVYYSDRKDVWSYKVRDRMLVIWIYSSALSSFVDITINEMGDIISEVEADAPAFMV